MGYFLVALFALDLLVNVLVLLCVCVCVYYELNKAVMQKSEVNNYLCSYCGFELNIEDQSVFKASDFLSTCYISETNKDLFTAVS